VNGHPSPGGRCCFWGSLSAVTRSLSRIVAADFMIELSMRKVEIAGIAPSVNGFWTSQIGGNLAKAVDRALGRKRYFTQGLYIEQRVARGCRRSDWFGPLAPMRNALA
jgi:hypothetical protein